jgi:prepilin-type processing-associated H-X9-DG protein
MNREMTNGMGAVDYDRCPFFNCPSAPKPSATKYGLHYGANRYTMFYASPALGITGNSAAATDSRSSSVILVADVACWGAGSASSGVTDGELFDLAIDSDWENSPATASTRGNNTVVTGVLENTDAAMIGYQLIYKRHNNRCHAVMADGHVQAFTNGEVRRRNFASKGKHLDGFSVINMYYP